ncbi:MAG: hypothetical protein H6861_09920 [Rhodospirillales bacterium]|nr:hypothetical protein [Rhodospirillales bacterium]
MMFRLLVIAILLCSVAQNASAQDGDNVEIHLDSLDDYTPPPMMFETPQAVKSSVQKPSAPLPQRKPVYHGPAIKRPASRIDEGALAIQSAQDILRAIDENYTEASEPEAEPVYQPPAPKLKDLSSLERQGHYEIALPFEQQETALTEAHKKLILQQILIRLQKYDDATLEIRSYASSSETLESAARRIALSRAVAVEQLLLSKGIQEQRIFLRALEQHDGSLQNSMLLVITR